MFTFVVIVHNTSHYSIDVKTLFYVFYFDHIFTFLMFLKYFFNVSL